MCMICERIRAIKNGTNPYFVQELETGYVVLGDHQHFKGYTLFLCKQHAAELFCLEPVSYTHLDVYKRQVFCGWRTAGSLPQSRPFPRM